MRSAGAYFASALNAWSGQDVAPALHSELLMLYERFVAQWVEIGASQDEAERRADESVRAAKDTIDLCESPIEQIALARMATVVFPDGDCPSIYDMRKEPVWPDARVVVAPQFPIGRYRVDFLISIFCNGKATTWALECDGQEFHSALADRDADAVRDGFLARVGIVTKRMTGAEIYRNRRGVEAWLRHVVDSCQ